MPGPQALDTADDTQFLSAYEIASTTSEVNDSAEGKEELVAPTKDGELLPRSLDLTVTQVLYRSSGSSAARMGLKPRNRRRRNAFMLSVEDRNASPPGVTS